jgi:parvulin-like peptidyl-prolyl isomerase
LTIYFFPEIMEKIVFWFLMVCIKHICKCGYENERIRAMNKFLLTLGWLTICMMVFVSGCKPGEKYVGYPGEAQSAAAQQPSADQTKEAAVAKEAKSEQTPAPTQQAAAPSAQQQPLTPAAEPAETKAAEPNVVAQSAAPADPNTVLVTVNSEGITEGRLDSLVKPMLNQRQAMGQQANQATIDQMRSQMLDNLITDALVRQQIEIHKVVVTDGDVDNYIKEKLADTEPPMTFDDLKSRIQQMGGTYEQWKQMMGFQKRLQMEKLLEANYPEQMKITDANAKKFYDDNPKYFQKPEQVRASHILCAVDIKDPCKVPQLKVAAKKKADDILDQIRKGADFAEMAEKYSEDLATAKRGGDLDYFGKSITLPDYAKAAFNLNLKVGEVSDVFETAKGYHIIKVTDHRDPSTMPFEKAEPSIIDALKSQKEETLVETYLAKLKGSAKIVYPSGSTLRPFQPSELQIEQPSAAPATPPAQGSGASQPAAGQP